MSQISKTTNNDFSWFNRLFDILLSSLILLVFSPVLLLIFVLIKLASPGKVIYCQERVGKDGNSFIIYKFRTMVPNADKVLETVLAENQSYKDEYEKYSKLRNDPRVIPGIGRFLRKTSMDEIPQFINVLKGDMSVVGPRPYFMKEISDNNADVKKLLSVKPGVTGFWQVSDRNHSLMKERIEADLIYIEKKSLWLDIKIVFKTIKVVLMGTGY